MPVALSSGIPQAGAKSRTWAVWPSSARAKGCRLTALRREVRAVMASMLGWRLSSILTEGSGSIMSGRPVETTCGGGEG